MGKQYSAQERQEAVKLAKEIGAKAAAQRLGVNIDTLYTWISKAKQSVEGYVNGAEADPVGYAVENARLKKELAKKNEEIEILQDALGFFVERRKK